MYSHGGMQVYVGLFPERYIFLDSLRHELEGSVLLVASPPLGALIQRLVVPVQLWSGAGDHDRS